jgi:mannose-1-phosphate guanylyltransferase
MAPVGGLPFLDYLLQWLRAEGVEEVILCVGYKKSHIKKHVGAGRKWGLRVRYSAEKQLLGTAGALRLALHLLCAERVFVLNGDSFLDLDLRSLLEFHLNRKAAATLAAVRVEDNSRYGSLKLNDQGRILSFFEKVGHAKQRATEMGTQVINGGIYVFEKELLSRIPPNKTVSLEREVFPSLLPDKSLFAYVAQSFFLDIGVPKDLERAKSELPYLFQLKNSRNAAGRTAEIAS